MTQTEQQEPTKIELEEDNEVLETTQGRGKWLTLAGLFALMILGVIGWMLFSHLPRAETLSDNPLAEDTKPVPSPVNLMEEVALKTQPVTVQGLEFTLEKAQTAESFSDLKKKSSPYTTRIYVKVKNTTQKPIGFQYVSSEVALVLSNGKEISPKFAGLPPELLQGETKEGYIDFPVDQQISLGDIKLRIGTTLIPLKEK